MLWPLSIGARSQAKLCSSPTPNALDRKLSVWPSGPFLFRPPAGHALKIGCLKPRTRGKPAEHTTKLLDLNRKKGFIFFYTLS